MIFLLHHPIWNILDNEYVEQADPLTMIGIPHIRRLVAPGVEITSTTTTTTLTTTITSTATTTTTIIITIINIKIGIHPVQVTRMDKRNQKSEIKIRDEQQQQRKDIPIRKGMNRQRMNGKFDVLISFGKILQFHVFIGTRILLTRMSQHDYTVEVTK